VAGTKAPAAAGVIHADFEKGFIKAETISYQDLVSFFSFYLIKAETISYEDLVSFFAFYLIKAETISYEVLFSFFSFLGGSLRIWSPPPFCGYVSLFVDMCLFLWIYVSV
jgi:hypothetical protein